MLENAITTITKKYTMTIGSKSWREGIIDKTKIIASWFISAGLWRLSVPAMQCQLKLFKDGGIADSEENPTWVRYCETFRTEVLSIPPEINRQPQMRQTIDVNNPLLLREHLIQIDPWFLCPLVLKDCYSTLLKMCHKVRHGKIDVFDLCWLNMKRLITSWTNKKIKSIFDIYNCSPSIACP